MIGHVAPEAALGGPLAALNDGDLITIDIEQRRADVNLTPEQIAQRLRGFTPPPSRYPRGVFAKYSALVSSAAEGAVTGFSNAALHAERSKRNGSNLL
jgi:dihydroxy-acid dehydratase